MRNVSQLTPKKYKTLGFLTVPIYQYGSVNEISHSFNPFRERRTQLAS